MSSKEDNKSQVIYISGPGGIGKNRLKEIYGDVTIKKFNYVADVIDANFGDAEVLAVVGDSSFFAGNERLCEGVEVFFKDGVDIAQHLLLQIAQIKGNLAGKLKLNLVGDHRNTERRPFSGIEFLTP